jgi:hypothetical protein
VTTNNAFNNTLQWFKVKSGNFLLTVLGPTLTANIAVRWPSKAGTIAVDTVRSESIQNLTTEGLLRLPPGADSAASIATAAQIRTAAGVGTISVQNSDILTLSRNTTGQAAQLRLFGSAPFGNDPNNGVIFGMTANNPGNRQLLIYASDDPAATGAGLRAIFNGTSVILDAVSPDGSARQDMIFGSQFRGVAFGGYAPLANTTADFYQSDGRTVTARFRNSDDLTILEVGDAGVILHPSTITTPATNTTTGAFQLNGIGMGGGRGVFNVGTSYVDSTPGAQINRSLYFNAGNPVFRLGDGRDISPIPVALPAPTGTVIDVPYNATATTFASRNVVAGLQFQAVTTNRVAGTVTSYPIVADGINLPSVSAPIQKVAGSLSYDNRNGVVNTFQFTFDGTSLWYQILRAEIPPLTGLTTIATNFSVINGNFTNPSANTYGSSSTTAFSGSGGSAQAIPAGKDGQITALVGPTTIVGLHNNNTTAAVPSAVQTWLYYVWNAGGTLNTGEGTTTQASSVTGVTGNRYVQIRRTGSTVAIYHRVLVTDNWVLVRTMPTANSGQLFVMLGTTSPNTAQIISLEVAA